MRKTSLLAMAALAALTACSAVARTGAETADVMDAPPIVAAQTAPQTAPTALAGVSPVRTDTSRASYRNVSCEVRSRRTANGLLLQARAFADRAVSGEYDLVITKSGPSGSSDISQSGLIDLAPGGSALLGENEISVERGARVRAVLTLRDESGQLCRRTVRL